MSICLVALRKPWWPQRLNELILMEDAIRETPSRVPFGIIHEIEAPVRPPSAPCPVPRPVCAGFQELGLRPACIGNRRGRGVSQERCLLRLSHSHSTPSIDSTPMWMNKGGGMAEEGVCCGHHHPDAATSGACRAYVAPAFQHMTRIFLLNCFVALLLPLTGIW